MAQYLPPFAVVTDGMTVMRLLAEGKTNAQITEATGIPVGSIAAYKAWNTMYAEALIAWRQASCDAQGTQRCRAPSGRRVSPVVRHCI